MNRPELAGLTIKVEILKARDLIAKDRNVFGKRTTSDAYVKVQIGKQTLGKTKVIPKNLNPVWNETLQWKVGADSAAHLIQPEFNSVQGNQHLLLATLTIWDHDKIGDDDIMGTVEIPLDPLRGSTTEQWYPVGKGSGKRLCHNAKGDIQVKITFEGNKMMQVARGQAHTLQYNRIRVGLAWDVERGQHVDLDSTCVAVGHHGQILMDETVYYGNLTNTNLSIQHSGDELTGEAVGDDEKILLELDRIPSKVLALYIILTVATPGKTFSDVKSAQARFISTETRQGICRYVPHTMGGAATALFLCRLSRRGPSWVLTPIEEADMYARDFGSLIPEIKGYTRDLVPGIHIDTQERIAIMRKGGNIRISDYVPGGKIPANVSFGLAWDVTNGVNIDLDASAIMLDANYQLLDMVYFKQLTSKDGSIRHSGDEREGDEDGDDESISISLLRVSLSVKYIGFIVNSYSGQELDDVDKAGCHLFDPKTKSDIATYTLTNCKEVDKHTALVMGCLYRGDSPDDWYLRIISLPAQGKVAHQNVDDLQAYLLCNPPQPPLAHSEEEIVLTAMPDAVPIDEEIVVVFQSDFSQYAVPMDEEIVL
jgi:tellurium resistance protein TerZ